MDPAISAMLLLAKASVAQTLLSVLWQDALM